MEEQWRTGIDDRTARIGVVGLGYVGLPLLMAFARGGFRTLGLDVDESKITRLKAGQSYIRHIAHEDVADLFAGATARADATSDFARCAECDALLICVPTPLTRQREPDLSYVLRTGAALAPGLRTGQLVVLESTTYPGTTEEELAPVLEKGSGLRAGRDFHLAYSPEREDPNNRDYSTATIPKVVGGLDAASLEIAVALYGAIVRRVVPVSSCRAAEATKLTENIFRSVNIALANELKTVFAEMDIDVWEVVRAAATKPFGFMPFYPGPGLGGHCIPIDPFYLTWKAREYGLSTRFVELAGEINTAMPDYVVRRTVTALNDRRKAVKGSRILLVGLAYKPNVDDDRESPTYRLWKAFEKLGARVDYFDPFCPEVRPSREHSCFAGRRSVTKESIAAQGYDAAVIATAHADVDHDELAAQVGLIVDTRGVCRPAPNVVRA
jgi:UDP-N-acetyl-D-glucosamine dehydrogenase